MQPVAPGVVVFSVPATLWPTVELLAVTHALVAAPTRPQTTVGLAAATRLGLHGVQVGVVSLARWGWLSSGVVRDGRHTHQTLGFNEQGQAAAQDLLADPAAGMPVSVAVRLHRYTLTGYGLDVLAVLATDPDADGYWTLPALEQAAAAAGLTPTATRAEVSKLLWRHWISTHDRGDQMAYALTCAGKFYATHRTRTQQVDHQVQDDPTAQIHHIRNAGGHR